MNPHFRRWSFFALWMLLLNCEAIEPSVFRAHGTLAAGPNIFNFEAAVMDCRWHLKVSPLNTNSPVESYESVYDGTNAYFITYFSAAVLASSEGNNVGTAVIEQNNVPLEEASLTLPIWLAYASHCYFNEETNSLKFVFGNGNPRLREIDHRFPIKLSRLPGSPNLPEKIEAFSDGTVLPGTGLPDSKFLPPFDKGFLTMSFVVLKQKNEGAYLIPEEFEYSRHLPTGLNAKSSTDVRTISSIKGTLDKSSLTPGDLILPPRPKGRLFVDDRRFQKMKPPIFQLHYDATNAFRSITDPVLLKIYKNQAQSDQTNRLPVSDSGGKRTSLIVLVLVLVLMPLVYWMKNRAK